MHDTGEPHVVLADPCWQALAPLQVPVLPQGGAAAHWPAARPCRPPAAVQVPGVVPLQVWQVPQAALPQQTPFTQLPLMHSAPAVHAVPFGFSAQLRFGAAPWQVYGARQWESIEHVARQVVPPHR